MYDRAGDRSFGDGPLLGGILETLLVCEKDSLRIGCRTTGAPINSARGTGSCLGDAKHEGWPTSQECNAGDTGRGVTGSERDTA